MTGFTFSIEGKINVVADALSRTASAIQLPTIDYYKLARDQKVSDEIRAYKTAISGLNLKLISCGNYSMLCDTSTGFNRPVMPKKWKKTVFDTIHNLNHPSAKPTMHAIVSRFVWHGMKKDI